MYVGNCAQTRFAAQLPERPVSRPFEHDNAGIKTVGLKIVEKYEPFYAAPIS
jgi:hypothetical protein